MTNEIRTLIREYLKCNYIDTAKVKRDGMVLHVAVERSYNSKNSIDLMMCSFFELTRYQKQLYDIGVRFIKVYFSNTQRQVIVNPHDEDPYTVMKVLKDNNIKVNNFYSGSGNGACVDGHLALTSRKKSAIVLGKYI